MEDEVEYQPRSSEVHDSRHRINWLPPELRGRWNGLTPEERRLVQQRPPPLTNEDIEEIRRLHPVLDSHPLERAERENTGSPVESITTLDRSRAKCKTNTELTSLTVRPRKSSFKSLLHVASSKKSSPRTRNSREEFLVHQQNRPDKKAFLSRHPDPPITPPSSSKAPEVPSFGDGRIWKRVDVVSTSVKYMDYEASGPRCNLVEQGLVSPPDLDLPPSPTFERPPISPPSASTTDLSLQVRRGKSALKLALDSCTKVKERGPSLPDEPPLPTHDSELPRMTQSISKKLKRETVHCPSEQPSHQYQTPARNTDEQSSPGQLIPAASANSRAADHPGIQSLSSGLDCNIIFNKRTALARAWSGALPGRPEIDVCIVFTRYLADRMVEQNFDREDDRTRAAAQVDVVFKWLRRYGEGQALLLKTNEYPIPTKYLRSIFGFFVAPLWMQETHRYDILERLKQNASILFNVDIAQDPILIAKHTGLLQIITDLRSSLGLSQTSLVLVGTDADFTLYRANEPSISANPFCNLPFSPTTSRFNSIAAHIILSGIDDVQIFDVQKCLLTRHNAGIIAKSNIQFYAGIAIFIAGHPVAVIEMLDQSLRREPLDKTVIHWARDQIQGILEGIYRSMGPNESAVQPQRESEKENIRPVEDLTPDEPLSSPFSFFPETPKRKVKPAKSMGNLRQGLKKKFNEAQQPRAPLSSFFEWSDEEEDKKSTPEKKSDKNSKGSLKSNAEKASRMQCWAVPLGP